MCMSRTGSRAGSAFIVRQEDDKFSRGEVEASFRRPSVPSLTWAQKGLPYRPNNNYREPSRTGTPPSTFRRLLVTWIRFEVSRTGHVQYGVVATPPRR